MYVKSRFKGKIIFVQVLQLKLTMQWQLKLLDALLLKTYMHIFNKKITYRKQIKREICGSFFFNLNKKKLTFKGKNYACSTIKFENVVVILVFHRKHYFKFQFVVINYIASMGVEGAINYNRYRKFYVQ